jgi:regulator of sigma E protease
MTLLIAILGLAVLILAHEAGHFYASLAVGMRPRSFNLGFGPPVVKVTRNGIDYAVRALPLGGYVKIPGMHRPSPRDLDIALGPALERDPSLSGPLERVKALLEEERFEEAVQPLDDLERRLEEGDLPKRTVVLARRAVRDVRDGVGPDAYWRQAIWRRITAIIAGPATNIFLAVALLAAVYVLGVPNANSRAVESIESGKPAASLGLRPGDVIVAVNGRATPTFDSIRTRIGSSGGRPITLTVRRGTETRRLGPERPVRVDNRWILGFLPRISFKHYSAPAALRLAADDSWLAVKGMGLAIAGLFHEKSRGQLTSTVGIVRASDNALKVSFRYYVQILAFISLSLGLLNLLPLLPLDGGHILFAVIEGIRGRSVTREVYERASVIGFALLMIVAFIALSNDLGGKGAG